MGIATIYKTFKIHKTLFTKPITDFVLFSFFTMNRYLPKLYFALWLDVELFILPAVSSC